MGMGVLAGRVVEGGDWVPAELRVLVGSTVFVVGICVAVGDMTSDESVKCRKM